MEQSVGQNVGQDRLIYEKKAFIQRLNKHYGGDGGIRTHGRFHTSTDFESVSLQPLRYVSVFSVFYYNGF